MSADFLQNLINANLPTLGAVVSNGWIRLLKTNSPNATDDRGFLIEEREPRTEDFWPCNWKIKYESEGNAGKRNVATQTRAVLQYEITLLEVIERREMLVQSDDLLEFKLSKSPGSEVLTLRVTAVIDQSEGAWMIHATDTNAK